MGRNVVLCCPCCLRKNKPIVVFKYNWDNKGQLSTPIISYDNKGQLCTSSIYGRFKESLLIQEIGNESVRYIRQFTFVIYIKERYVDVFIVNFVDGEGDHAHATTLAASFVCDAQPDFPYAAAKATALKGLFFNTLDKVYTV